MKEILQVQPLDNNMLSVWFNTGENFNGDIKPFIKSGASSALTERTFFNSVKVEEGYITCPNGFDFCPEFLYEYAKAHHD